MTPQPTTRRNSSPSWSAMPTAAAPMARSWVETILPSTPPELLAAAIRGGERFVFSAAANCEAPNYVALQSMLDETGPHGRHYYDRLHYLPEAGDDFIDALLAGLERAPSPHAHVMTAWMGGAIDGVAPGDTAFGHRGARALSWIIGCSADEPVGPVADWVRRVWEDTAPFAAGGAYVNALNPERSVRDAYAEEVWERLVAVKRRYDPNAVFSGNGVG